MSSALPNLQTLSHFRYFEFWNLRFVIYMVPFKQQSQFKKIDRPFVLMVIILTGLGLAILASVSIVKSQIIFQESYYYLRHQFIFGVLGGLIAFYLSMRIPYRWWRVLSPYIFFTTLALTALVFMPSLGFNYGGARRWLALGPIIFQPSEILKIGFILYIAVWLSKARIRTIDVARGLLPFLVLNAIVGLILIMQPDMGTLGIIYASALALFFLAGARIQHLVALLSIGLVLLLLLVAFAPYRLERVLTYINPESDPLGGGYQLQQSLIALGSGGVFGLGYGESQQKYGFLPEVMSDSIFAVIGEEIGFVGTSALLALFLAILYRGVLIGLRITNTFGKLLVIGMTSLIVIQAFTNIAAITGIIPLTGLTLPLISYGSSSMVVSFIALGIVARAPKEVG